MGTRDGSEEYREFRAGCHTFQCGKAAENVSSRQESRDNFRLCVPMALRARSLRQVTGVRRADCLHPRLYLAHITLNYDRQYRGRSACNDPRKMKARAQYGR